MRPLVVFLIVILSLISVHSQQFYSLNAMEDSQGNTQLFYRLGDVSFSYNPICKFNTNTFEDSLLISAFYGNYPGGELSKTVTDFEFFPDDETNFINVGEQVNPDNHLYIARNDSQVYGGFSEEFRFVDISPNKIRKKCL